MQRIQMALFPEDYGIRDISDNTRPWETEGGGRGRKAHPKIEAILLNIVSSR